MADKTTSNTSRREPRTGGTDIINFIASAYHNWANKRLIDCYRRNSVLLREYVPDKRTIRVLCAIEEHLRARTIDPDRIIEEVEEADP